MDRALGLAGLPAVACAVSQRWEDATLSAVLAACRAVGAVRAAIARLRTS